VRKVRRCPEVEVDEELLELLGGGGKNAGSAVLQLLVEVDVLDLVAIR